MKANLCDLKEPITPMQLPYTNSAHQKDIENCKTKTDALKVMQRFIAAHGGNANAPSSYWEKLRALGVIE